MRILAITRPLPTPHLAAFAPHHGRQFAELARRHEVRVICPVPRTSMMQTVIAGAVGQLADALVDMLERSPAVPADVAKRLNLTWEHSAALFAHHMQSAVARRVAMRNRRVRSDLSISYASTSPPGTASRFCTERRTVLLTLMPLQGTNASNPGQGWAAPR